MYRRLKEMVRPLENMAAQDGGHWEEDLPWGDTSGWFWRHKNPTILHFSSLFTYENILYYYYCLFLSINPRIEYWLILEEASEAEGHQLQDGLQDEDDGEDVVTDRQRLFQLLRMSGREMLKINKLLTYPWWEVSRASITCSGILAGWAVDFFFSHYMT